MAMEECLICAKHRGEGSLGGIRVWEDEHSLVFHRPVDASGTTMPGYLFVESRRHVPYLADLTDVEAAAIGRVVRRAAEALRAEVDAEFVFSAVAGMSHAHFHQHLFVRHRGTPAEYGWMAGDQWPGVPRSTAPAIAELCVRLRPYLAGR
ncbi:HIT family protein [Actinoplanes sp. NPDC023801]|uniref:HIT family protein n=1 Tax=Actinoplanes sp. NPDC023801 TaxID=3154595 RepID=UPI0033D4C037